MFLRTTPFPIELTFKAYAIQAEPFANAVEAWKMSCAPSAADEDSLQEAISSGAQAVSLSREITLSKPLNIPAGSDVRLFLAGNTITCAENAAITVEEGAKLSADGGKIIAPPQVVAITNNGVTELSDIEILRTEGAVSNNNYLILNRGNMALNDGVSAEAPAAGSSLIENGYQDGSAASKEVTLTINGGEYIGGLNPVKNDDWGVLEINDGYFENNAANQYCVVNFNKLAINGGTFYTNALNGRVVFNASVNDTYSVGAVEVYGGDFTAKQTSMFDNRLNVDLGNGVISTDKATVTFYGGVFRAANGNYNIHSGFANAKGCKLGDGYKIVRNRGENGYSTVVPA